MFFVSLVVKSFFTTRDTRNTKDAQRRKDQFVLINSIVAKIIMKPTRFNVVVQKDDAWYVAKCVDNSVASQGKTIEEALDNLKEALELYYEDEPFYALPVPALLTSVEVAV